MNTEEYTKLKLDIQNEMWNFVDKMKDGIWVVEHTEKRKVHTFLCDKIDELPKLIDVAKLKLFEPELKSALSDKFNKISTKMMDGEVNSLNVNDVLNTIYTVLRRKKR